jgi:hypothetical protein
LFAFFVFPSLVVLLWRLQFKRERVYLTPVVKVTLHRTIDELVTVETLEGDEGTGYYEHGYLGLTICARTLEREEEGKEGREGGKVSVRFGQMMRFHVVLSRI